MLAAELIDSRVERLDDPLAQAEVFDPPTLRLDEPAIDDFVGEKLPVGADDAVEPQRLPKQPRDDVAVEPEADLLDARDADRDAVVGHHLCGSGPEGGKEWLQVEIEAAAGVHLILAVGEVRILTVLLCAPAREVLGHAGDALAT